MLVKQFSESLWIAGGAAVGANLRYWIGVGARSTAQSFPWPTMLINILGSMVLGAFAAVAIHKGWGWQARLFVAVGLCGGFTTFSTFSFEFLDLVTRRSWKMALVYALLTFTLSIGACFLGGHFGRVLSEK